jgi:uncharacterized protein YbgA (DUF1722 family)/uncharacterized protein YbbK (DUF523 family)
MEERIKIGISACLLGNKVHYDGGHKLDRYLTQTLGPYVEYVPVCPELECGLGVPRKYMRLVGSPPNPRLVTGNTNVDHTDRMLRWAPKQLKELENKDLYGFIFKKNSPSCGMERVKVYNDKGIPAKAGAGLFAKAFRAHFPRIPVAEEERLNNPELRENFIAQVFAMKRWREALSKKRSIRSIVDFHTRHKLMILSHNPTHYRQMGKLVAGAKDFPIKDLYENYKALLMAALKFKTTVKKNINVLQHLMGYFKKLLSTDEKQELLEIIRQYHSGYVPLIVPVTLFNHYVRKYKQPYLQNQTYLNPHPVALKLRNHA